MTLPVLTWVLELKPSEKTTFELTNVADLKITNATLDPVLQDETGRSTVVLHILGKSFEDSDEEEEDDEKESNTDSDVDPPQKLVLTSLTPGKIESSIHDIVITRPATVVCEVIGKNTIHLSGYLYVPENEGDSSSDGEYPGGEMNFEDDDSDDEDYMDEMEHDLEPDESELGDMASEMFGLLKGSGRFEEVDDDEDEAEKSVEAPIKATEASKKRQRESDDEEPAPKLSKKEKKKLKAQQAAAEAEKGKGDGPPQKKQKAEDGKAVPVAGASTKGDTQTPAAKEKDAKKPNGDAAPVSKKEKAKAKGEKSEKETAKNTTNGTDGKDVSAGKTIKLPNGLSITDTKVGTGTTAKKGSQLGMRYIGKLANGTVFDSNTTGRPFKFRLGKGDVIRGWDEGLVGMKVGGERRLVIPPSLGYGKQKVASIPPNSTLTFEVKLIEIS